LVKPRSYEQPQINQLESVRFIDRMPMVIPEPLVIEKNQRPLRK